MLSCYEIATKMGFEASCPYEWQLLDDYLFKVVPMEDMELMEDHVGDRIIRQYRETEEVENLIFYFFCFVRYV